MASAPLVPVVNAFDLTTVFQDLYTVESDVGTFGIDAITFNNYSAVNVEITARIVQTGAGGVLNEFVSDKRIRSKESFLAPAMIGHAVLTGGKIQAKASVNSSISASITGTKITN